MRVWIEFTDRLEGEREIVWCCRCEGITGSVKFDRRAENERGGRPKAERLRVHVPGEMPRRGRGLCRAVPCRVVLCRVISSRLGSCRPVTRALARWTMDGRTDE